MNQMMLNCCKSRAYIFGWMIVLCLTGCSPGQLPEQEPITPIPSLVVEPVESLQPEQIASVAYPSPEIAKSRSEGYPEPVPLVQVSPYPEPETIEQAVEVKLLQVKVVNSYPHNVAVFTQGLEWADGFFYESGGLYGQSALYRVGLVDGVAVQQASIEADFFAEGMTLVNDKVIMLTWQKQTALVFDKVTFEEVGRFNYTGQGWGLCYDESNGQLWMSDGSDRIVSRNPDTFEVTGEVFVTLNGAPLTQINELECVNGVIYANLWKSEKIMGISQQTGAVEFEVDASGLLTAEEQAALQAGRHVLNGIAYDGATGRFYLTGKQWPRLFEVEFE